MDWTRCGKVGQRLTAPLEEVVAAAADLMKRANATAIVVTQAQTGQPIGIITDADISHLVADGKNPNDVRIIS